MKIAIIQAGLIMSGGGERQAIMLAKELRKIGHDAQLYAFYYDAEKCFPEDTKDIPVISLSIKSSKIKRFFKVPIIGAAMHFLYENKLARELANRIPEDTEILNPHDQTSCRVSHYFKKKHKNVPAVLMLNDLHTASWSLFDDKLFGRVRKSFLKTLFYRLKDYIERAIFWKCINNIAVLNERTTQILRRETGFNSVVVRSGVDLEKLKFKQRPALKIGNEIKLLAHGIFYIHRRYEDIIKAVRILRDKKYNVRLQIIGDFSFRDTAREYHKKLIQLVKDLNVAEFVSFSGVVSEHELIESYYESDIFISATHMQTWGLAVFEAITTGLPSIISRTIGAAEVLRDGDTSIFIEPGNPDSIVSAVTRVVNDGVLYERLGRNGSEFVRENLSWKKYAENMLDIFKNVS